MITKNKIGKRGQIQIQETILVIFIFTIIIIVGMSVFFRIQENSIKQEYRDFKIKQKSNFILTLPGSSDFVYTKNGLKADAIDVTKLFALKELVTRKPQTYFTKYGYLNITIYEVYPERKTKECKDVNDLGECGVWNIYSKIPEQGRPIIKRTPVSIYYPNTREYSIGVMVIGMYNV